MNFPRSAIFNRQCLANAMPIPGPKIADIIGIIGLSYIGDNHLIYPYGHHYILYVAYTSRRPSGLRLVWVASTEIELAQGMYVLSVLWAHIILYKALDQHEQHENHRHRSLMAAKVPSHVHVPYTCPLPMLTYVSAQAMAPKKQPKKR